MGKYAIDTSSLLALARYYIPFDHDKVLYNTLKKEFASQHIVLLSSVWAESERVAQGLVKRAFPYLEKTTKVRNRVTITGRQHKLLDKQWAVPSSKKRLGQPEYEQQKRIYIGLADFQLIAYAMANPGIMIITEESRSQNDRKLFKKIPVICKEQNIACENIAYLLNKIRVTIKFF